MRQHAFVFDVPLQPRYWELHIKEDERHGKQMLDDVALPLVDK